MKILLIFFVLLFSSSVVAEKYASWGIVEETCENALETINLSKKIGDFEYDLTNRVFRGTMQAYMSGINWWIQENYEMFKHLNHNSVDYAYSYVLGYCENNPKNKFGEGILQYMVELPYIEN